MRSHNPFLSAQRSLQDRHDHAARQQTEGIAHDLSREGFGPNCREVDQTTFSFRKRERFHSSPTPSGVLDTTTTLWEGLDYLLTAYSILPSGSFEASVYCDLRPNAKIVVLKNCGITALTDAAIPNTTLENSQ